MTDAVTRTDAAARIKQELENMGYAPVIENHSGQYPNVVVIDYHVHNGRCRGWTPRLGISMSGDEMWPEYPPHFLHLPPIPGDPPKDGGIYGTYSVVDADGAEQPWIVLSRPPGAFWDSMPTKGMKGYMEHIARFWDNV